MEVTEVVEYYEWDLTTEWSSDVESALLAYTADIDFADYDAEIQFFKDMVIAYSQGGLIDERDVDFCDLRILHTRLFVNRGENGVYRDASDESDAFHPKDGCALLDRYIIEAYHAMLKTTSKEDFEILALEFFKLMRTIKPFAYGNMTIAGILIISLSSYIYNEYFIIDIF